jgi:hypothetical protein
MTRNLRLNFKGREGTDLEMGSQSLRSGLGVGNRGERIVAVVDRIAEEWAGELAAGGMAFAYGLVSSKVEMRSGQCRRAGHWTGRKNHRAGIVRRQQQRKDFAPGKRKQGGRGCS